LDSSGTGVPGGNGLHRRTRRGALREAPRDDARIRAELEATRGLIGVGRAAVGIAHDFANVLTAVIGRADLVLEDSTISPVVRADIEELRAAADRAVWLARDLVKLGRQDVGGVAQVDETIADMEPLVRRLIGEDVLLVTALGAGGRFAPVGVSALGQVVLNLALNGRDAMPAGGRLEIRTSARLDREHEVVSIVVRDSGEGMDAATRRRAFEHAFTTKADHGGSGIGLATVRSIVVGAGGSVRLASRPGHGTRAEVRLPVCVAPERDGQAASALVQ
jgi:two-component system, cell cycle sensor histidine kinase and response regulator CckA